MTWDRPIVAVNFQAASDLMPREGKLRFPKTISLRKSTTNQAIESSCSVSEVAAYQRDWYNSNSPH